MEEQRAGGNAELQPTRQQHKRAMCHADGFFAFGAAEGDVEQDDCGFVVGRCRDSVVAHARLQGCSQGGQQLDATPGENVGQLPQGRGIALHKPMHDRRQHQLDGSRRADLDSGILGDGFKETCEASTGALGASRDDKAVLGTLA